MCGVLTSSSLFISCATRCERWVLSWKGHRQLFFLCFRFSVNSLEKKKMYTNTHTQTHTRSLLFAATHQYLVFFFCFLVGVSLWPARRGYWHEAKKKSSLFFPPVFAFHCSFYFLSFFFAVVVPVVCIELYALFFFFVCVCVNLDFFFFLQRREVLWSHALSIVDTALIPSFFFFFLSFRFSSSFWAYFCFFFVSFLPTLTFFFFACLSCLFFLLLLLLLLIFFFPPLFLLFCNSLMVRGDRSYFTNVVPRVNDAITLCFLSLKRTNTNNNKQTYFNEPRTAVRHAHMCSDGEYVKKKKNGTVSGKHLPLSVWEKRERERHEQLDRPCLVYRCSHTHALHCLFVILTVKWIPLPFFFFWPVYSRLTLWRWCYNFFFFLAPPSSHLFTRFLLSSMRAAPRIFFFLRLKLFVVSPPPLSLFFYFLFLCHRIVFS